LRQIIDIKTDKNSGYLHGTGKYNQEHTTVYDLAKLNFGMLEKGENSDSLVAKFNIVEVMQNLYEIRKSLTKNNGKGEEAKGEAIESALVRSKGTRSNSTL